jgi:hypothetical protein
VNQHPHGYHAWCNPVLGGFVLLWRNSGPTPMKIKIRTVSVLVPLVWFLRKIIIICYKTENQFQFGSSSYWLGSHNANQNLYCYKQLLCCFPLLLLWRTAFLGCAKFRQKRLPTKWVSKLNFSVKSDDSRARTASSGIIWHQTHNWEWNFTKRNERDPN